MLRTDSLEKILMLGKIEGKRKGGQQRLRRLESITDSMDMNLSELWKIVKERGLWRAAVHGIRNRFHCWLFLRLQETLEVLTCKHFARI